MKVDALNWRCAYGSVERAAHIVCTVPLYNCRGCRVNVQLTQLSLTKAGYGAHEHILTKQKVYVQCAVKAIV